MAPVGCDGRGNESFDHLQRGGLGLAKSHEDSSIPPDAIGDSDPEDCVQKQLFLYTRRTKKALFFRKF